MTEYELTCLGSGHRLPDSRNTILLGNAGAPQSALLRTEYQARRLQLLDADHGIYRFRDWLPLSRSLSGSSAPITYKSNGLARELGLNNLYVTFSGYWPERDALMLTGTFKECEAFSVCGRIPDDFPASLVVASAGNTARAFIHVCSQNRIPAVVVVPEKNLDAVWSPFPVHNCVTVVAAGDGADYSDAIDLAAMIASLDGYVAEGGARNVARRDGMGTTVLSAVTTIGRIPDYFFQAIGSGTGAIAAWEANRRFLADGRFGKTTMKLMLSQNAPFLLMYDSWRLRSRALVHCDEATEKAQINDIYAAVLSNRNPPYSVTGGLYDALCATDGEIFAVENHDARAAAQLFEDTEGIDIAEAAAVAVASLVAAVRDGSVEPDATIMLNITGGGMRRFAREQKTYAVAPRVVVSRAEAHPETVARLVMDAPDGARR
ncbi:MAG: cysteate synthase [Spirochaetaceae bacterium]|nr:MAG: cysteate synthase [Spirochaetaceae bacterium]